MKQKKIILFLLILLSTSAQAAVETFSLKLDRVGTTWAQDGIIVSTKDTFTVTQDELTCSGSGKFFMTDSNLMFKENLGILLSAFHVDSKVSLSVNGCNGVHLNLISVSVEK